MNMKAYFNFLFLFLIFSHLACTVEKEREELLDLMAGEWVSHGIYAATKLDIPEYLDEGAKSVSELAELTGVSEGILYRLLSMLASQGIFCEKENHYFSHNDKSKLLSEEHPFSLKAITLFYIEVLSQSWDGFMDAIKTGVPGFNQVTGKPVFQYFQQNPKAFSLFQQAMAAKSKAVIHSALLQLDFSRFSTICDVGGGKGHFIQAILNKHSNLKGILFDLPEVIEEFGSQEKSTLSYVSGNFFENVPKGADCYLLKSILHDWNDQDAIKILTQCRKAMSSGSTLLIVEPILMGTNHPDYAKLTDILMMNITGGKERTLEEFHSLLTASGFQIKQTYQTSTEFCLIEAY